MNLTPEQIELNKKYQKFKRKFCKGMSMITHETLAECREKFIETLTEQQKTLLRS
jgi:hypothetical protein